MTDHAKDPVPFTHFTACPSCQGTGATNCESCKGRGWKQAVGGYSLIPCPICNGHKQVVCQTCRGNLKLPEWRDDGEGWRKNPALNSKEKIIDIIPRRV